jgi:HD-like signal output (HDOD) protein
MVKPEDNLHQRLLTARLPALPQVLLRFLDLCRRDDAGLDEIGRLIAQEPAMAARILTLAASASHYQGQAPRDLLQCLLRIGLDGAKAALVAESVHQVFDAFAAGRPVDLGRFWRHSLTAALIARRLAKETGYARGEEAYLAGLLHDVGQLAMVSSLPEHYLKAFADHHDDSWLANWEALALGLTHAEVGAWLAGRWQLDSYLADALLYHHEPAERVAQAHPLVRITWLAHALAHDPGADVTGFDLDAEAIGRVIDGLDDELAKAARFLGIDLDDPDATAAAQGRLAEAVRPMALAGAQLEIRTTAANDLLPRLQALMTAARSLYGVGEGVLFSPSNGCLRGKVAWLHMARLEELEIPLGSAGGCVGIAASSSRVCTSWDADCPASILDDQLRRALGGEGLFCLPLASGKSGSVLVFGVDRDKAQALAARPPLTDNFAREAARSLGLDSVAASATDEIGRDRLRRAVHEANNPLGIIRNYLHILGERLAGQEGAADIALIKAEIDRVGRILRGLTAPEASPSVAAGPGVDLNQNVRELVAFCRDTDFIPATIRVDLDLAEGLPALRANPDLLKQILLNLVKNAVEALPADGRIGIATRGPVLRSGTSQVLLRVSDNGPGLPEDVRARLFQPVVTRKGETHAGLGIAIVGEIVARLQGHIDCRSDAEGTVFEIHLPLAARPASPA